MKRPTFVILILIIASTQVKATTEEDLIREARSLFTSVSTQEEIPDVTSMISEGLNNIRPIISFVKSQIKDIMIDLLMEVWNFMKSILRQYKVKLFKRIGKFTVSDIFRCVFDGVVEFVKDDQDKSEKIADEVPEEVIENVANYEAIENDNTLSEPVDKEYEPSYILSNPYLLARYNKK